MRDPIQLETSRLILRRWQEDDRASFAALNADPEVRAFFPSVLSRDESDEEARMFEGTFERLGYGLLIAELRATGDFLGFIGLMPIDPPWPRVTSNAVEIGWRLKRSFWGQGLATEGARAVLQHAFRQLGCERIYSITAAANSASRRVMAKLGMHRTLDFQHPRLASGHPLHAQVLYVIDSAQYALTAVS